MPSGGGPITGTQCTCHLTGGRATCPVHQQQGGSWPMPSFPMHPMLDSDRLAREVAMASVIWLASDGNDDAYDDWKSKVERWKERVLDGRF